MEDNISTEVEMSHSDLYKDSLKANFFLLAQNETLAKAVAAGMDEKKTLTDEVVKYRRLHAQSKVVCNNKREEIESLKKACSFNYDGKEMFMGVANARADKMTRLITLLSRTKRGKEILGRFHNQEKILTKRGTSAAKDTKEV